jgi:hypothetical protein
MDFNEQWNNMQQMFLPSSEISATFRENARQFWENQGKVLDNMQALSNGWFERRRTGTHTAREAAERMCGTKTYFDLVQEYQAWARGAFERIMADQQQIIEATTSALASPPLTPSASEKVSELARPARSVSPARRGLGSAL